MRLFFALLALVAALPLSAATYFPSILFSSTERTNTPSDLEFTEKIFRAVDPTNGGKLTLYATNPFGFLGITMPPSFRSSNVLSFSITNPVAGDVLKIASVAGSLVVITNGVDNNSGGGGSSTAPVLQTNTYVGTNIVFDCSAITNGATVRFTMTKATGLLFTNAVDGLSFVFEATEDSTAGWYLVLNGPNWRLPQEITGLYNWTNALTISAYKVAVRGTNAQLRGLGTGYLP